MDEKKLIAFMDEDREKMLARFTHQCRLHILMEDFNENVFRIGEPSLANWIYLSAKFGEFFEAFKIYQIDVEDIINHHIEFMKIFLVEIRKDKAK